MVSKQDILAARTPAGGWRKVTLAGWGVPWPPPSGWQAKVVSGEYQPAPRKRRKTTPEVAARRRVKREARKKAYNDYLHTGTWLELRRLTFERDAHRCRRCGASRLLHCHHQTYLRFGGQERLEDLVTLCEPCHQELHDSYRRSGKGGNRRLTAATQAFVACRLT